MYEIGPLHEVCVIFLFSKISLNAERSWLTETLNIAYSEYRKSVISRPV